MPIEILMPALSPTMTEGTLAKWTKKEGDTVAAGDVIAEIETDKATMEVEAVDEGTLGKIIVAEGTEMVAVNKCIALLLEEGEDKAAIDAWKPKEEPKAEVVEDASGDAPAAAAAPAGVVMGYQPTKAPDLPSDVPAVNRDVTASPVAKRMAKEKGVILEKVKGTGPAGRVVKEDVENFLKYGSVSGHVTRDGVPFSKQENNGMRKTIAKRLLEAKQTIPHFYLSIECELDKLLDTRAQLNSGAPMDDKGKPDYKISVNDLVIKASALALRDKPEANASWYDDAIVYYNDIDVSVAVSTDGGLITPIIQNADQKSLAQISTEMKSLAKKARDGKLQPEEYQGGGFSVSNLGMFGIKSFSAIINPPQSCILAVGAGEKKLTLLRDGVVDEITVMTVTLSVDHRSVDGVLGAEWLQIFKHYIENPALLVG
ncbi:MAG: pyruvate dehydrogenase complex dihydrolipoamide acetyltransferase [Rickettsiales bacterium]|nr:pyruvate dehydrogenase complex dihydrolipoamide acetyltransferase [Rickettsiales bacterium]